MSKKSATEVNDAYFKNAQDIFAKQIAACEKFAQGSIELNGALVKNTEALADKVYDNYVANVAATFDGARALNKAADMTDFFKAANANNAATAERIGEQSRAVAELFNKAARDTADAGRAAFQKNLSNS